MSNLSALQEEALTILQEECGELIVAISKMKRFGVNDFNPYDRKPNMDSFIEEVADVICMIEISLDKVAYQGYNKEKIDEILVNKHARKLANLQVYSRHVKSVLGNSHD